ncbi:Predicted arabinose efflux permease, MFS family [Sphingomonas guangdongensis]|uniref:Predicted arabinose efflux permease, MFS family n=1 Tax=Sphingomonas guangdongensis TaxID=1141890 RepID=A0A285R0S1_9SPHN|nr:MFS transporter [Sphingomonas guangdongensis]SOB87378.1 Predicted arabinose efflux permease, MFS family [Sphingomonas guangdongensis]
MTHQPATITPADAQGQRAFLRGPRAAALLAALFLVCVFAQVDRILPFILAEAIKAELRLSDTALGLLTGVVFAACYALLSLPMARLADEGSPRVVLVGCALVWSAMTALGGAATGFATLAATRFGVALGEAGAIPSSHALIARRIRPERRGLALGLFSMGIPLGTMVGFAAGGALGDRFGWRMAMVVAGVFGAVVSVLAFAAAGRTPAERRPSSASSFIDASRALLRQPAFRALIVAAISIGFAAAPFYAFAATFLIRSHELSAAQAGLIFGGLQGLMGTAGTLLGGRGFDAAVRAGSTTILRAPAIAFMLAGASTLVSLFVPVLWVSVAFMLPAMFAFAYTLPFAFGVAHQVAGVGREGMASSLAMIASGLFGPALGPLLVGAVSDGASAAGLENGLAVGLLLVPVACVTTALLYQRAGRRIAALG